MSGVRLTEQQAVALRRAAKQCDALGNYAPYSAKLASDKCDHIAYARVLVQLGLLSEPREGSGVFFITPAGRAWLERNKV
jgi:hypothetical protein